MKELDKKVVNIFTKHKENQPTDTKVIKCDDGIYCVTVKTDKHGNPLNKDEILQDAMITEYIVKVLIETPQGSYINNYKVSGEKILAFLSKYTTRKKQGQVIEIDKYIPDDLA